MITEFIAFLSELFHWPNWHHTGQSEWRIIYHYKNGFKQYAIFDEFVDLKRDGSFKWRQRYGQYWYFISVAPPSFVPPPLKQ